MKNTLVFMLASLLLLVSFFSSVTTTGSFWRDSVSGARLDSSDRPHQGGTPSFLRSYTLSPARLFVTSSQTRTIENIEKLRLFEQGDGLGDLDYDGEGDGDVDQDDCYSIQLIYGRTATANSAKVPNARFQQQRVALVDKDKETIGLDENADIDGDGAITYTDVNILCTYVQGLQDAYRDDQLSKVDCSEEGQIVCNAKPNAFGVQLHICAPDPSCTRSEINSKRCPLTLIAYQSQDASFISQCVSGGRGTQVYTGGGGKSQYAIEPQQAFIRGYVPNQQLYTP